MKEQDEMTSDEKLAAERELARARTTLPGEELPPYIRDRMSPEAKKIEAEQRYLSFDEISRIARQADGDKTQVTQEAEIPSPPVLSAETQPPAPPNPPGPPAPPTTPTTWKK